MCMTSFLLCFILMLKPFNMKTRLLFPFLLCFCLIGFSQCPGGGYTCIPDTNFELALIDLGHDNVEDGQVLTANISGLNSLDVSGWFISDLSGIEAFSSLQTLSCDNNDIVMLDLTSNMNLTHVYCYYNSLTSLLLPDTDTLIQLEFYNNFLTDIDLSPYINLDFLRSYNNPSLGSLNVSTNTKLVYLYCHNNGLNSLDVSQNPDMEVLDCYDNNLMSLDVSNNLDLWRLWCQNNSIAELNVSSHNSLQSLYCYSNGMTSLSLPTTPTLTNLRCQANDLPSLDASGLTGLQSLRCFNNPNMTTLLLPPTNTLTYIDCESTDISTLDASSLMNLNYLDVYYCYSLTNLMLPPTTTLETLWAYSTGLSNLDFTSNTGLLTLDIANGNFTSIDVSMLNNLLYFWCNQSDNLTSLNLKNGNNDMMATMNSQQSPLLECIEVDNPALAETYGGWTIDNWTEYMVTCPALGTDVFDLSSISIYPNPTKNVFEVDLIMDADYKLFSIQGQQILDGSFRQGLNTLDVSAISNGIYLLNFGNDFGNVSKKLVKN